MRTLKMKTFLWVPVFVFMMLAGTSGDAFAADTQLSQTDFTGFTTGVSVDGQGGWGIGINGTPGLVVDEKVMDDGTGNIVFRLSNAQGSGDLNDMPFAPRPAGIPNYPVDTANNPVLGQPDKFAGESSTTASFRRFVGSFEFKSATGAAQASLTASVSPDNGAGGRMGYVSMVDSGTGIDLITYDIDSGGNFVGPTTIATGLNYTSWHKVTLEILFYDGPSNDVVKIYLDDVLIHTGTSWEDYIRNTDLASYPNGVPVQTLVISCGTASVAGNLNNGFYYDNVYTAVGPLPGNPGVAEYGDSNNGGCFFDSLH